MGTSSTVDVTYVSLDKPLDYSSVNCVILGIACYFMYRLTRVVLAVCLMFVKATLYFSVITICPFMSVMSEYNACCFGRVHVVLLIG